MRGKPGWVKAVAAGRVEKLLVLAEKNAKTKPLRARRYVQLACRIASRCKVRVPVEWKRRFCKKCFAFWVPGKNVKVRANSRTKCVERTCTECGFKKRYGYAKGAGFIKPARQ